MSKAILENITRLFDAQRAGDYDAAFLYALIAVDGTSKKLYSEITGNRSRYVKFLRTYYWVLEPMMGVGLNLKDTRFDNLSFDNRPKGSPPDFAEVVYEKHRCTRVHGDDVPFGLELIPGMPGDCSWEVGRDHLRMPTSMIWALTAAVVLCHPGFPG